MIFIQWPFGLDDAVRMAVHACICIIQTKAEKNYFPVLPNL